MYLNCSSTKCLINLYCFYVQKRLQVYTDIHVERCLAKWQEKKRSLLEVHIELINYSKPLLSLNPKHNFSLALSIPILFYWQMEHCNNKFDRDMTKKTTKFCLVQVKNHLTFLDRISIHIQSISFKYLTFLFLTYLNIILLGNSTIFYNFCYY